MHTQKAAFDDVTLAYQVLGDDRQATPLLMIMGLTGVKEDWAALPAQLAADRQVLIYDNRGMGESSVPDGPYTIEMLAEDARKLLEHIDWPKAHVFGISMGGMIAQTLALKEPGRIEKLVLGCTAHGGRTQALPGPDALAAFQVNPTDQPRDIVRRFMWVNFTDDWIAKNPTAYEQLIDESMTYRRSRRGMMHQLGAIMTFDVAEKITGIEHETLVIHGREDRLLPYPNAELIAAKIPRCTLIDLPNAGHMFWRMDEGESARTVREFLKGA
jgi:pimeloyl-ACP methyl ester carboxylesterase